MKPIRTMLSAGVLLSVLAACGEEEGDNNNGEAAGNDTNENAAENNGDAAEGSDDDEISQDDIDELVLGFVPSSDSDEIADTVEPLADQLSEELDIPVDGRVMTDYSALVEAMGSDEVQVGFIPAFAYILASDRHDIEVALKSLRDGEDSYKAQYSVREDAEFESLEDLEGATWASVDVASTSGYLFPATQVRNDIGMSEIEFFGDIIETGSHDNALITVLEGNADVATTFDDARGIIEDDYPEVFDEENGLRVLDYTEPIPNDTISYIPELSDDFADEITEAFMAFNDDEEMIDVMYDVYEWDGIDTAEDEDYDIVRDAYEEFSDEVDPLED